MYAIKRKYGYIVYGKGKLGIFGWAIMDVVSVLGRIKYTSSTNTYDFYPSYGTSFDIDTMEKIKNLMDKLGDKSEYKI
jgi:hypothetical protein